MSTEQKPGVPAATTPVASEAALPTGDAQTLQLLIQLLLAERQEQLQERQEKAAALRERDRQRRINAESNERDKQHKQEICTHKKGGKGLKGPKVDYAVSFHTFVDGSSYIRCLICGAKWKNTDTDEFLVRRGQKIPNHTGIGWKRAYQMISESTNTATSSEIQLRVDPVQPKQEDFEANPRAVEI